MDKFTKIITQICILFFGYLSLAFPKYIAEESSGDKSASFFYSTLYPILSEYRNIFPILTIMLIIGYLNTKTKLQEAIYVHRVILVLFIIQLLFSTKYILISSLDLTTLLAPLVILANYMIIHYFIKNGSKNVNCIIFLVINLIISTDIVYALLNLNTFFLDRITLFYANANHTGAGVLSSLFVFLLFSNLKVMNINSILRLILIIVAMTGILISGSRSSILAALVFLVIYYRVNYLLIFSLFSFVAYKYLSTIIKYGFEGRDNRFDLWYQSFEDTDFSIIFGMLGGSHHYFIEGFYVTLYYTLGLPGLIMLLYFLSTYFFLVKKLWLLRHTCHKANFCVAALLSFFTLNIFESAFLGVMTQQVFAFMIIIAFIQVNSESALWGTDNERH